MKYVSLLGISGKSRTRRPPCPCEVIQGQITRCGVATLDFQCRYTRQSDKLTRTRGYNTGDKSNVPLSAFCVAIVSQSDHTRQVSLGI